jgi:hypothetical protein
VVPCRSPSERVARLATLGETRELGPLVCAQVRPNIFAFRTGLVWRLGFHHQAQTNCLDFSRCGLNLSFGPVLSEG